jgi:SAM-dependent methyltransferase
MVSTFNTRATSAGLSPSTVHAVVGDLFDKSDPSPKHLHAPEWMNFDLATVGFGFHHFEDVVHSAKQLKERLRPGGVLVINDFLEGGDVKADEEGKMVEGNEGNHAVHGLGHGHGHGHGHSHAHDHAHDHAHHHSDGHSDGHSHHHHHNENTKHDTDETSPSFTKKMNDSVVVPHFTLDGVKEFFTKAGFVDIEVFTLNEKSYMEFAGKKLWRTILIAKGRRPGGSEEKSEL